MAALARNEEDLLSGLAVVREAPRDLGQVRLIVRRPAVDAREVLAEGELDVETGLVGDTWAERAARSASGWHARAIRAGHPDERPLRLADRRCARSMG